MCINWSLIIINNYNLDLFFINQYTYHNFNKELDNKHLKNFIKYLVLIVLFKVSSTISNYDVWNLILFYLIEII